MHSAPMILNQRARCRRNPEFRKSQRSRSRGFNFQLLPCECSSPLSLDLAGEKLDPKYYVTGKLVEGHNFTLVKHDVCILGCVSFEETCEKVCCFENYLKYFLYYKTLDCVL